MRKWWVVTFQQIVEFIISFGSITKGAKPLNSGYLLVAPRFNRLQVARNTILYWTKLLIWIETFLFAEINVVAFDGNLFVCYAKYRNKRLRIISNIFSCCRTGSEWRLDISRLVVCHFQVSQLLEAVGILVNSFCQFNGFGKCFCIWLGVSLHRGSNCN